MNAGSTGGVYKSIDAGASWTPTTIGLKGLYILALAIDPITPTTLFVGTDDDVFKSDNGGASWSARNNGLPSMIF